jgi:hypothetical protein
MENWKWIPEYENFYQASDKGRVRSVDRKVHTHNSDFQLKKGKVLSPAIDKLGYVNVALSKNNKLASYKVHRLVALAHIPNPLNLREINHKDCNKENNTVENLEWCTRIENLTHAIKNKLIKYNYGDDHHNTLIKESEHEKIKKLYYTDGEPVKLICKKYKVHYTVIYRILKISETIKL